VGGLTEEGFCWCGEEEWRETGTEHGRIGCAAEAVDERGDDGLVG